MGNALLKFRRGSIIPTTLDQSEPFWDDTSNTLIFGKTDGGGSDYITITKLNDTNTGNFSLTGDVSASNIFIAQGADISGNVVIGGSLLVGGEPVSTGSLAGVLSGSLIPTTGSVFDVGSTTKRYKTGYFDTLNITNGITASIVEYSNVLSKPTLVSGSSQINHNSTTGYLGVEHVNHSAVSISPGDGLSGGGTIESTRTLTLSTGSLHFTDGVKSKLNTEGVVSGSSQLTSSYDSRYALYGVLSDTTTSISGHLIPTTSASYDLGSINYPFRDLYITTASIHFVNTSGQIQKSINTNNILTSDTTVSSLSGSYVGSFSGDGSGLINLPAGDISKVGTPSGSQIAIWAGDGLLTGSSNLEFDGTTLKFTNAIPTSAAEGKLYANGTSHRLKYHDGSAYKNILLKGDAVDTGSYQIDSSSFDSRISGIVASGSGADWNVNLVNIPSGLVSGSEQIKFNYNNNYIEVPSGSKNGSNLFFTTSQESYESSSLIVYLGGLAYIEGNGVTESSPSTGIFEMDALLAPNSDDYFYIQYALPAIELPFITSDQTSSLYQRNYVDSTNNGLSGSQNGSNLFFTTSQAEYLSNSVLVFSAGVPLSHGNGITESNPSSGIIEFNTPPESFDILIVQYSN